MGVKWHGIVAGAAGLLLLSACSTLQPHPLTTHPIETPKQAPPPPEPNLQQARQALLETDAAFARAVEDAGMADAFYDYLSTNAVLLLPGEIPVRGNDAIKVHLTVNPPGVLLWRARDGQVSERADLGYTWGTYERRPDSSESGRPQGRFGKYLIVWKKQVDGTWKAAVFSASPSPATADRT
ncbi:MAG TPA: DUF4440 domain-containing protein [Verrucomicrobiae bacterium]|nr:DUF4440 domain-containing protein [Verrucomicrobiae bacterium]